MDSNSTSSTYNNLIKLVHTYKDKVDKISISGGGDPLYNYEENESFWNNMFRVTQSANVSLDVHTRVRLYNDGFWNKVNKVALSSDNIKQDKKYINYLRNLTKVRIVHVITKDTTKEVIDEYVNA